MQIHRISIICTSFVCMISLLVSIFIAVGESYFKGGWFTFFISLSISIFASALLILIVSIISLKVSRKQFSQDFVQLLCGIVETHALIGLFLQDNRLPDGRIALRKSQIQVVDKLFDSLIQQQKKFIGKDRIAWPRPSILIRSSLRKETSVYSVESRILVSMLQALEFSSACHTQLTEILYLDGQKQQDSKAAFARSWHSLGAFFKKGGQIDKLYEPYLQKMHHV